EVRPGLRDGDTGLHAADTEIPSKFTAACEGCIVLAGRPKVDVPVREEEGRRHDSDDGDGGTGKAKRSSDHRRIGPVAAAPERIADQDGGRSAIALLRGSEVAPEGGAYAPDLDEARRNESSH